LGYLRNAAAEKNTRQIAEPGLFDPLAFVKMLISRKLLALKSSLSRNFKTSSWMAMPTFNQCSHSKKGFRKRSWPISGVEKYRRALVSRLGRWRANIFPLGKAG
jgi:hypothetical protein